MHGYAAAFYTVLPSLFPRKHHYALRADCRLIATMQQVRYRRVNLADALRCATFGGAHSSRSAARSCELGQGEDDFRPAPLQAAPFVAYKECKNEMLTISQSLVPNI